jgi:hypothetical protein
MPVSQAAREALVAPVTLFRGDATNITDTEGLALLPNYKVLSDCTLKRLSLDFATLTGGSQFTFTISRDSIVLTSISTATPGVAGAPTTVDVDIDLDKDDVLTFSVKGADADADDATGVCVEGLLQVLRDQSDA